MVPTNPRKTLSAHCRVRKGKGTAKEDTVDISEFFAVDMSEFFNELRDRKWALYVPERIYMAHRDGLLRGWGIAGIERTMRLLELLKSQGVDFKIPVTPFRGRGYPPHHDEWFLENFSNWIVPHEGLSDCPPFPETVISSDSAWDGFLEHFGLTGTVTHRILAVDGWVHRVRFFTLWATVGKKFEEERPEWVRDPEGRASLVRRTDLPPDELKAAVREWNARKREVRNANRILREDYGLALMDYCNNRRTTLVVLKKVYPPEQVRHVRRQLEEKLRKDNTEVIRYALARGFVK